MKTIILGCPKNSDGIEFHIEKTLREYGYNVVSLAFPFNSFKYKNWNERLINFIKKTFFRDKTYKNYLKFKHYEKELNEKLDNINKYDCALIIRTDIYPEYFIKKIKSKSEKMYSFHWDGLDAYSGAKKHIKYYDKFYVFDPNDVKYQQTYSNILGLTNFYFEKETNEIIEKHSKKSETRLFYLGTFKKDRYYDLLKIYNLLKNHNYSWNINLLFGKPLENYNHPVVKLISNHFSYFKNLVEVFKSDIIIDLTLSHHNGLSFRPFEAIAFEKKLITTNKSIKHYDFYHSENIFIFGEDKDLEKFISGKYYPLSNEIKNKYSFKNWFKNITEDDNKILISLPKIKD